MTITAQPALSGPYNGNGSTTAFDYAFRVDDEADLVVTLRAANGIETVQTLTTHYTVAGVGAGSGGTITMVTAPATGEQIVITRSVGLTQEVDLQNRGSVDPETLEQAYDKLTQIAQDQQQQISRAVKTDLFDATSTDELIANINAVAAVDGEIADIAAAVAAALDGGLLPSNNLSDLTDVEAALNNLNHPDQLSRLPIKADSAIAKGAVVYATGAVGSSGRLTVDNYIADASITEVYIIGISDRALATNDEGYAIAFGELRNVSTDGSTAFGSETWTAGTVLYADPNNAGYLTNVEPTYPDVVTPVAMVLVAHASNGILFARPNIDEDIPTFSQATWETGTETTEAVVSPAKVKAAIDAQVPALIPTQSPRLVHTTTLDSSDEDTVLITGLGGYRHIMVWTDADTDTSDSRLLRVGTSSGILSTSIYVQSAGAERTDIRLHNSDGGTNRSGIVTIYNFNTTDAVKPVIHTSLDGNDVTTAIDSALAFDRVQFRVDAVGADFLSGSRFLVWGWN